MTTAAASLIGLLVLTSGIAHAQASMRVLIDGKQAGVARLTQKLLPSGGKEVRILMILNQSGPEVRIRQESTYDHLGNPVRQFQEMTTPEGKRLNMRVANFSADGASVTLEKASIRQTQKVPLEGAAPRANRSEFWFIRDQPKDGETLKFYRFDLSSLKWRLIEVTYEGRRQHKALGRIFRAHSVKMTDAAALFDDAGLPLRIESGQVVMERAAVPDEKR